MASNLLNHSFEKERLVYQTTVVVLNITFYLVMPHLDLAFTSLNVAGEESNDYGTSHLSDKYIGINLHLDEVEERVKIEARSPKVEPISNSNDFKWLIGDQIEPLSENTLNVEWDIFEDVEIKKQHRYFLSPPVPPRLDEPLEEPELSAFSCNVESLKLLRSPPSTTPAAVAKHGIGPSKKVGIYSPSERRERILRFLEKRKRRVYHRRIRYQARSEKAVECPRYKGRFIKRTQTTEQAK